MYNFVIYTKMLTFRTTLHTIHEKYNYLPARTGDSTKITQNFRFIRTVLKQTLSFSEKCSNRIVAVILFHVGTFQGPGPK